MPTFRSGEELAAFLNGRKIDEGVTCKVVSANSVRVDHEIETSGVRTGDRVSLDGIGSFTIIGVEMEWSLDRHGPLCTLSLLTPSALPKDVRPAWVVHRGGAKYRTGEGSLKRARLTSAGIRFRPPPQDKTL